MRHSSPQSRRVAEVAELSVFSAAEQWFTRERAWINDRQLQLCRIAAPTFFEQKRAEWFRLQLESLGWNARQDRAGNVLATFENADNEPSFIVSAHLDTVLAPSRPEAVYFTPQGRFVGPGVSDNGSGLTALLALARVLKEIYELHDLASSLLLVANVGEEGEGNLSGMRYLCRQVTRFARTKAFIVLDGPSIEHITAQALASRRFEVSFTGPGGHSWNDYGTPNPIHALCEAVTSFLEAAEVRGNDDGQPKCSYNFGLIQGGTSINSIASQASVKVDLRSEDASRLHEIATLLNSAVERSLEHQNRTARSARLAAKIRDLGFRPGGKLPEKSPLLRATKAVDGYLNIGSRVDCASTDANIPLSLGLPAICIGTGGQGGGAHTLQEWYQPEGRELGLKRVLLILATLAELTERSEQSGSSAGL